MPITDGADTDALPPELKRLAMEALEAPELYETPLPSGFVTLMRLWHYEEEGAWRAWSLSSRPSAIDAPAVRVRRVVWDRSQELARLAATPASTAGALVPRIRFAEARFPMESWSALLEEANALKLQPLLAEVGSPKGGARERFGLTSRLLAQTVSFEWWEEPPTEWKELAEWAMRVRTAMDAWLKR